MEKMNVSQNAEMPESRGIFRRGSPSRVSNEVPQSQFLESRLKPQLNNAGHALDPSGSECISRYGGKPQEGAMSSSPMNSQTLEREPHREALQPPMFHSTRIRLRRPWRSIYRTIRALLLPLFLFTVVRSMDPPDGEHDTQVVWGFKLSWDVTYKRDPSFDWVKPGIYLVADEQDAEDGFAEFWEHAKLGQKTCHIFGFRSTRGYSSRQSYTYRLTRSEKGIEEVVSMWRWENDEAQVPARLQLINPDFCNKKLEGGRLILESITKDEAQKHRAAAKVKKDNAGKPGGVSEQKANANDNTKECEDMCTVTLHVPVQCHVVQATRPESPDANPEQCHNPGLHVPGVGARLSFVDVGRTQSKTSNTELDRVPEPDCNGCAEAKLKVDRAWIFTYSKYCENHQCLGFAIWRMRCLHKAVTNGLCQLCLELQKT